MTIEELKIIGIANKVPVSDAQATQLEEYSKLLVEWNAKINMISRKDEANILSRHILHSLTLSIPGITGYDFASKNVLDIGTGGGLPGIPLKIVIPSLTMTLVDSIQKKIMVCGENIAALQLKGIRTVCSRAEELAKLPEHARKYDAVISRAVAPLDDLLKWTRGLIKPAGAFFSLKGGDLNEEIERTERLAYVKRVTETPLLLKNYVEFANEGKKLIRVDLNT